MERSQVGVLHVHVEAEELFLMLSQVRPSVKIELQVGVVGDQSAVKAFSPVGKLGRYPGIVVSQGLQAAHPEGVHLHVHPSAVLEDGVQARTHGKGAQGIHPQHFPQVEIACDYLPAKLHVPVLAQDVVQVDIGQDIAYGGGEFPLDVQGVHGAFHPAREVQAFPGGEAGEVQLGGGRPRFHEIPQPLKVEGGLADVHGEGAFFHVDNVPDAAAGLDNHVMVHVLHQNVFQPYVIHRSPYFPLQEAAEADVPEAGKVGESSGHVQPGAFPDVAVQYDAVYKVRVVV